MFPVSWLFKGEAWSLTAALCLGRTWVQIQILPWRPR